MDIFIRGIATISTHNKSRGKWKQIESEWADRVLSYKFVSDLFILNINFPLSF